ncbi:hypothetical protein F5148DRAFT_1294337 [Russula earlei]|uniref:Uncharacterized protein n=1 Tax=Russula earlei TaxID=71964 RepID=A0ACC0TT57_9AGAM|nr:hypothetical protein F5148DRAFT_1294337 [Russula earlei]
MSGTPPTSPQQSQAAACQAEHASCTLGSPEQRRTPASTSTARQPVHFQGQVYNHLPANLAAQLAALRPMPAPPQCRGQPSLLAPPPIITRSHSAAPGSGSGSGPGSCSVAASASVYESCSGSVSTPDFATNPPFPYPIRQYQHLPANLAAQLAAIPPPQQRLNQLTFLLTTLTPSGPPSMLGFPVNVAPAPAPAPTPPPAPAPAPPTPSPPSSPVPSPPLSPSSAPSPPPSPSSAPSPPPSPSSAPPSPLPYPHAQVYPEDPLPHPDMGQPQLPPQVPIA